MKKIKKFSLLIIVTLLLILSPSYSLVNASSSPELVTTINPGNFNFVIAVNGVVYFMANDTTHGYELWKTDGTETGTVMIKDINPGSAGSLPSLITPFDGSIFFTANDGVHGEELWKSDGTDAGTVMVKDIRIGAGGSSPYNFKNSNGTLFFTAHDGTHGYELWKTDGTEGGTVMVKDIKIGTSGSFPDNMIDVNGVLYFDANDGTRGQIWKSDGTESGTVKVTNITTGAFATSLTNINGTIFFVEADGQARHGQLWKTDGTSAGTSLVSSRDVPFPYMLTKMNNEVFFVGVDLDHGGELWKSDGTESGTVMVKDINPGPDYSGPSFLIDVNGTLFFAATSNSPTGQLWKSDGTEAGTVMVKDINPQPTSSSQSFSNSSYFTANGLLFFNANNSVRGYEMWESDGTEAGTVAIPNTSGGGASNLTFDNNTLFFSLSPYQLWKLPMQPIPTPTNIPTPTDTPLPTDTPTPTSTPTNTPTPTPVPNLSPVAGAITAPTTAVQVNTGVNVSAAFTDGNPGDTHTASIDWGDGFTSVGNVTENNGSGSIAGSHVYLAPDVYEVKVTVTDNHGGSDSEVFQFISVYQPTNQGLFTGVTKFQSPAGALIANPTLTGQVKFGVSSGYTGSNATGDTVMNFAIWNFEFVSTTIQSLVIANGKATLVGTGRVNGQTGYIFLVTGLNGTGGGQGLIRYQIKDSSNSVVYDTQPGAPATANPTTSVTGQVVVH